ncbi:MAG TPA: contractile injection system protein, VgrG/Pvc8 family [Pyrinomonadaceae bacterium]|jgi:phage protein D|nr:contractile injection system protein, VgrG/Pvc8 family [Pyrinomonadaceae bacterium]
MTEALLTYAGPVFEIDDDVKADLARDVVRLEIEETTAGLKTMTAYLVAQGRANGSGDQQQLYLDGAVVDFGKKISVVLGATPAAHKVFSGWISGLEANFQEGKEPEVVVFAEDKLMKLRMTRRMKTYENMSDADIASAIAAEHGLTPAVDADGPTYDVVQQWNQSDLAFLRERAREIQAEIWIEDETLNFKSRSKRTATELTLVQGNHLVSVRSRADLAHQRTKVKVSGYDAAQREKIDEEAGGDAIQAEVSEGLTGPAVLERAFGERVSYRVREAPLKSGEASDRARAEMLRRARGFVTVVATTRGSADMVVGSKLKLEGTGRPFEGSGYYVTRVCHTYDSTGGFRTHFEAERATIQEGP